jgi:hypothetical protein
MSKTNDFIIMWDEFGLECIIDITGKRHQYTMAILGDGIQPDIKELNPMLWRARMNRHRAYEIYAQKCDSEITEEDIREQFENNPQEIVNMIREKGIKLFSNRRPDRAVIK